MNLKSAARLMSQQARFLQLSPGKAVLPKLEYGFNALEPFISGEIMTLHHEKHHAAYVAALNKAEIDFNKAQERGDLGTMLSLLRIIKFNGGGHYNHSIFWTNLAPQSQGGGGQPDGVLLTAINRDFGSFSEFKKRLSQAATTVQGSGWGWLTYNPHNERLEITTTQNQDPVTGNVPLLGIDVWEHAYYLQYKNARANYVEGIWNVVNWSNIAERHKNAASAPNS